MLVALDSLLVEPLLATHLLRANWIAIYSPNEVMLHKNLVVTTYIQRTVHESYTNNLIVENYDCKTEARTEVTPRSCALFSLVNQLIVIFHFFLYRNLYLSRRKPFFFQISHNGWTTWKRVRNPLSRVTT